MSSEMPRRSLRNHLRIVAGVFVSVTAFWGGWAALMLAWLGSTIDETMTESGEVFQTIAALTNALEREDDLFVLIRSGHTDRFGDRLAAQRSTFDQTFDRLRMQLGQPASRQRLEALWESVQDYRAAGDRLVLATDREARMSIYQQAVNPALRSAIEECHQILGLTPRSPAP